MDTSAPVNGSAHRDGGLLALAAISLVVGASAGLVGAAFRLSLDYGDRWRDLLITRAQAWGSLGCAAVIAVCAIATVLAAWLVQRFSPNASGSGIPHVEAVLSERLPPAPWRLIIVKFIGGWLAIAGGLALGREGPTVQMGAGVAHMVGRLFQRSWADCRVLLAAGAGAGLATAFNAPIAGAVFVLEELVRRFEMRTTVATLGASAGAIGVSRVMLGEAPDFIVPSLPYAGVGALPVYLALGVVAGAVGVGYNRAILGVLRAADRFTRASVEVRAAAIGAIVGVIAWFAPAWVGGGDNLTQRALDGRDAVTTIMVIFLLRFALGAVSYAAMTPGGLFAPMLVLGAQMGGMLGSACLRVWPGFAASATPFAVVGMAAFFTAVVRAPITGIALVTEMTGSFTLLLPMLAACFAAMLVPGALRDAPIYDALLERTLREPTAR